MSASISYSILAGASPSRRFSRASSSGSSPDRHGLTASAVNDVFHGEKNYHARHQSKTAAVHVYSLIGCGSYSILFMALLHWPDQ